MNEMFAQVLDSQKSRVSVLDTKIILIHVHFKYQQINVKKYKIK